MPISDLELVLDSGQVVTADGNTTAIEVEGGFLAWACLQMGAMSGASTTFDARVMVSMDEGSNYYMAGKFQRFGPSDDDKFARIPVYIPRPDKPSSIDYQGTPFYTLVRLNYDVDQSGPSYAVTKAWLEPMLSLAVDALDEQLTTGAALRMAAV